MLVHAFKLAHASQFVVLAGFNPVGRGWSIAKMSAAENSPSDQFLQSISRSKTDNSMKLYYIIIAWMESYSIGIHD